MIIYIIHNHDGTWVNHDFFKAEGLSVRHGVAHEMMYWVINHEMVNYSRHESVYFMDQATFDLYTREIHYTLHAGYFRSGDNGHSNIESYVDGLIRARVGTRLVRHLPIADAVNN